MKPVVFVLRIVAVVAAMVMATDALVFRSGWYAAWAEPRSLAGSTRGTLRLIEKTYAPDRRNVLVLGNSRVGEGLSALLADGAIPGSTLHFVNGSVAGSDPRVWSYLLRAADPEATRFAAIVMMVPYDPGKVLEPMAERPVDIGYLTSLLTWRDVVSFPATFDSDAMRSQARRAILFPAQPMQRDIAAFLAAPRQRYAHVQDFRKADVSAILQYPGRPNALHDLPIDPATGEPTRWDGLDAAQKASLVDSAYFRALRWVPPPAVTASNDRYYREWISRIASPYRARGVPVVVFEVPRGPWHAALAKVPVLTGVMARLVDSGLVTALPGDTFVDLEKPEYFFDSEHMNRAGRDRFSPRLAQLVAPLVH